MLNRVLASSLLLIAAPATQSVAAQTPSDLAASPPPARPADVSSPQAVVAALYDVISGPAGVHRDWDRFRSLHYPGAHLIPTGVSRKTGRAAARMLTPEDYITLSGDLIESKGFFERELASRTEQFGSIAHVFSTYESRFKASDPKPFMRGINSIQLYFDGTRWWILNVAWGDETPQSTLPAKYLPSR